MTLPCHLSPYFTYGYAYKNTHPIVFFYRVFIARTRIYETNLIILLIQIIIRARCANFVYPGSVWWCCFAVWWRHRLPYTTSSTKTNDNKSQRSSLIWFSNRVSDMPKAPQRLRGKYIKFDETSHCSPFKKYQRDDQLSSKDTSTSSRTSQRQRLENVFYRNIRQCANSGHLVTVEANHHWLPNLLLRPQRQELTYTM